MNARFRTFHQAQPVLSKTSEGDNHLDALQHKKAAADTPNRFEGPASAATLSGSG